MNDEAGADNPWGASPSYRDRLSALQAEDEQHYQHQRDDIVDRDTLGNGEARRIGSSSTVVGDDTTMDADTYTARMKDILGSDGDGETSTTAIVDDERQAGSSRNGVDPYSIPVTPPRTTAIPFSDEDDDEASFQYPHALPEDVSFNTNASSIPRVRRPSTSSSSRLFTPRSISGTGLSSFRMSSNGGAPDTPQRPAAYPSISRLRASISKAGSSSALPKYLLSEFRTSSTGLSGSPTSSSSRTRHRPPLPFDFTAQAHSAIQDDDASVITPGPFSQHSRQSSFSSSFTGSVSGRGMRRRRGKALFPYGPVGNGFGSSAPSLASDSASALASVRPASDRTELKETQENSRAELSRDFVKWSTMRRIIAHVRSGPAGEQVKMTVLAVAGGLVAIGTQGGRAVVCDLAQEIVASCGHDGQEEGDSVTALAFSSDHTFLGVGHASGTIFLYDLKTPGRAARHIPPVPLSLVKTGRKEGHLSGSAILHIGFIGLRHTAIVTADSKGLAFYHALGKILGVSSNDTLRLLGKYPEYEHEDELGLSEGKKRSTIYQMSPLPLGPRPHLADDTILVAMITPTKLVLAGLKPSARTWFRKLNSETAQKSRRSEKDGPTSVVEEIADDAGQQLAPGCLAWFPASFENDGKRTRQTNPILAFSFGRRLHLVRLLVRKQANGQRGAGANGTDVSEQEELEVAELTAKDGILEPEIIVGLQWFNADLLLLATKSGLSLFDCRAGKVTERMEAGSAAAVLSRIVEQRNYDPVIFQGLSADVEREEERRRAWTVNHSIRISKGRSFFLTQSDLVVGSLLSWADRLLAYVSQGDFLLAIELATTFYKGKSLGSAVGLPSDPNERTRIIGEKLRELMVASAEYTFSPDRLTDATHVTADGRGVDRTSLFEGLTRVCATACLALGDMSFLFDQLYDKYEDNGIESIFVGQMEDFIVSGELRTLPIPVVQRLVAFRRDRKEYELAEQIIWHVDPKSLDLDQALSLCLDQKLYDALIYVYNSALEDFVSPIVELLEPLRRVIRARRRLLTGSHNMLPASSSFGAGSQDGFDEEAEEQDFDDAYKIFSYLSVVLAGHQYPSQDPFGSEKVVNIAKSSIFSFLFSGGSVIWPPGGGGKLVLFGMDDPTDNVNGDVSHEPIYPYLRLLLEFDAEAFLDALDLAFEDSYLDDEEVVGKRINRQLVVGILLELSRPEGSHSSNFKHLLHTDTLATSDDVKSPTLPMIARVFIYIFVARNAPKYPQFVRLAPQEVDYLLRSVAMPMPDHPFLSSAEATAEMDLIESTHEDRELAVEFLLSHYKPRFDDEWLSILEQASFRRILRSAFRQEQKWDRLMGLYLREYVSHRSASEFDSHLDLGDTLAGSRSQEAFSHIEETLFSAFRGSTDAKLNSALHEQLSDNIVELLDLDPLKTTSLLDRFFPQQHADVLHRLAQLDEQRLLLYLRCFFEPLQVSKEVQSDAKDGDEAITAAYNADVGRADADHLGMDERKLYLDVLCRYDAEAVVRNLDARAAGYFDLEILIDECRKNHSDAEGEARVARNSDAILWALDRCGRPREAFYELDRLVSATAGSIQFLVSNQHAAAHDTTNSIQDLVDDVRRSVNIAVRLCIERANTFQGHDDEQSQPTKLKSSEKMDTDEVWFRLLRSLVRLVHDVAHIGSSPINDTKEGLTTTYVMDNVRDIVQNTLSNLVSSTAAEAVSFPALFRRLTGESGDESSDAGEVEGAAKYYAEVRSVLDGMLSAYHLRTELLGITNKLFERDTFYQFRKLNVQRKRGWRPGGGPNTVCAHCGLLLVGPKRGTRGEASAANATVPEVGRQDRGQMSKDVSFSSLDSDTLHRQVLLQQRSPSAAVLSPAALHHRRRAKSSYDEKAAPLSSPRADKGKGVVRSTSSGSNGIVYRNERTGSLGADDEIDGYFSANTTSADASLEESRPILWSPLRDGSASNGGGSSLRIHDSPALRGAKHHDSDVEEENGSTGTMTPSRTQKRADLSSSSFAADGWGLPTASTSDRTTANPAAADERIIIKKSGQMYHESCFPSLTAAQGS